MQFSSVASISSCPMLLFTNAADMPSRRRFATWSFIRAMSGVITMHTPFIAIAGTWNVIDLPPPVGISPMVSLPEPMLSMISR